LARQIPGWLELNYFAASVAESANDWYAARDFYRQVKLDIPRVDAGLVAGVDRRLSDVDAKIRDLEELQVTTAGGGIDDSGRRTIGQYVRTAVNYLNGILGQHLSEPPIEIKVDSNEALASYWDGAHIVVPPAVQYLPDIAYREASWQHIYKIVGSGFGLGKESPATAILYSYVDVLPMLIQQHEQHKTERDSEWLLARGAVEWLKGEDLAKTKDRTPLRSFKEPGSAYKDPVLGKDRQVVAFISRDSAARPCSSGAPPSGAPELS